MSVTGVFERVRSNYAGDEARPLGGYLRAMGGFTGLVGVAAAVGKARGARLPEGFSWSDTVLVSVAVHKASRLLTKSSVTAALRAPFTRFEGSTGEGEVAESVPPTGDHRHALGELLTCPFCSGVWLATAFTAGLVLAPRATRLVATTLTTIAGSDYLHLAYDATKTAVVRNSA
ncbi:DUF1360 domain-containing protein [Umezawaea sp. Da 62-37]|uniref:DUF1360 domain-containing protein n=1 Tax=Umezawaea sp. Da 62-37 TaxID=3075927 RepID=UPI0028F6EF1C|nr:DUF1360 domain-containing protein [Umezawaea sp. Da 62-37]WNV87824.1 DUF1360 domain-containing protein [Umezawaea sp. Da 62-37]